MRGFASSAPPQGHHAAHLPKIGGLNDRETFIPQETRDGAAVYLGDYRVYRDLTAQSVTFRITSGLPTIRELTGSVNTSALIGT